MINPFRPFIKKTGDTEMDRLHNRVEIECLNIVKLTLMGKTTNYDIDKLEKLYKEYYKKYPDKDKMLHAEKQIMKLRTISK